MHVVKISANYQSLERYITQEYFHYTEEEIMMSACLDRLLQHYTSHRRQLILILREVNFDLSVISHSSTVKLHQDEITDAVYQKFIGTRVIPTRADVSQILNTLRWSSQTRFIVFLPRKNASDKFYLEDLKYQSIDFPGVISDSDIKRDFGRDVLSEDEKEFLENISTPTVRILKQFWEQRITNAIVAVPQKSNIYFYTYFPYTKYDCPDKVVPVLLNIWYSKSARFYKYPIRFFGDKTRNLYKCPLNISLIPRPPGIVKLKSEGSVGGIEGGIIMHIVEKLNATPFFRFVDPEKANLNESVAAMNFVLDEIEKGISDLGAGLLVASISEGTHTDNINFGLTVCLVWVVPNQAKEKFFVSSIFEIFTPKLWVLLFIFLLLSGLIFWLVYRPARTNLSVHFFKIIALTLGKNTKIPTSNAPRLFLMCFIWYTIIVNTAFQAGLGRKNILEYSSNQLKTTKDIIERGLKLTGDDSTIHLFQDNFIGLIKKNVWKNTSIHSMETLEALEKVGYERKTAYAGLRLVIRYYSRVLDPYLSDLIYIQKDCLIQYHPFLALKKNSPFTNRISELISRLIEGGFKDKLSRDLSDRMLRSGGKKKKSVRDFFGAQGALIILMFGLGLSFILFLCEHVVHYLYGLNQI